MTKETIRKTVLTRLRAQPRAERARRSAVIRDRLFREEAFRAAKCVMYYVSTDEEVDTRVMIRETFGMGKRVCVPVLTEGSKRMVASALQPSSALYEGPYGIGQPAAHEVREVPVEDIDVVIVPGVAFEPCGTRLGRGKGYYDRFLKGLPGGIATIGLAFDFQIVPGLPKDPHDVPVSKVLTA